MSRLDKLNHGLFRKDWLKLLSIVDKRVSRTNMYQACIVARNNENPTKLICKTREEILECLDSVLL